jgi:hypothetical protein
MKTGGFLNFINGKYGISAPFKSVPVMKLIRAHKPKSHSELENLIFEHSGTSKCTLPECGVKSQGSIEDFGRNLYEAQRKETGEHKHTLEECIEWEYALFVRNSLKGDQMENQVADLVKRSNMAKEVRMATEKEDCEYRIDLVCKKEDGSIFAIQVKPESYKWAREGVKNANTIANRKWKDGPVYYAYYNDNGEIELPTGV